MQMIEKCPVCDTENIRVYDTECVGLVEDHYFCKTCGYFREMAYSPTIEGIAIPDHMTPEEHDKLYGKIIKNKKLKLYDKEIVNCL